MAAKEKKIQNFFIHARKLQQWNRPKLPLLSDRKKTVGDEIKNKLGQIFSTKNF